MTKTILVIDDETTTLKMTKLALEKLDYRVAIFSKPGEALDYFEEEHKIIDLVITDKNMPKMGAEEVIVQFKKISANTPIIVLTGFTDKGEDASLMALGATKVLMKPVSMRELDSEIRLVLQEH